MHQGRLKPKGVHRTGKRGNIRRAGTPTPGGAALIQGSNEVQINDGSFTVVGGDSHTHIHYHGPGAAVHPRLEAILRTIPNFRKIQQDMLAKATPGTGIWLIKSEKLRVWLEPNGDIKIMWGVGIPGAGKTIIASLVISMLEALSREYGAKVCVAYAYIRYSDRDQVTVRGILEVLVKQTVERHPDCLSFVAAAYDHHLKEDTQPTEEELLQLLHQLVASKAVTFYVLDALDEAPPGVRLDLVKKLSSLGARLFITSRPLQGLQAKFPDAHTFLIAAQDQDLDLHIAQKLDQAEGLQDLLQDCDPDFKQQIVDVVKSKCGGMFLHASLQLDALQECFTPHDVMQTLYDFPEKIEDVYWQTWHRIVHSEPRHTSLAQAALLWVINAARSMTIDELRHALATSPETCRFESPRLMPEAALITACRGLITIDEESRLVRLVHYTAKRPLEELLAQSFPHPHSSMAAVCMTSLTDCDFQNTTVNSGEGLELALQANPLLAYAHSAWAFHTSLSLDLKPTAKRLETFAAGCQAFPALIRDGAFFDTLGPLQLLSFYGLPITAAGAAGTYNPNVTTTRGGHTPLTLACLQGHHHTAKALLSLPNIIIDAGFDGQESVLLWSVSRNKEAIVELLLAHPTIAVNVVDTFGWSALMLASIKGYERIARLLLAQPEIEVNRVDFNGWSALMLAASYGYTGILEALLAHPEIHNVNLVDTNGSTALMWAALKNQKDVVKLLLALPDIDVNLVDIDGCTALMLAAVKGHDDIVGLLLAHPRVDVNLVSQYGQSALMLLAAANQHPSIVELILAHPTIDVNITSLHGATALLTAAKSGNAEICRLLLAAPGINVNAVDEDGNTAFKLAAKAGHEEIIRMLLSIPGIDISMGFDFGVGLTGPSSFDYEAAQVPDTTDEEGSGESDSENNDLFEDALEFI